MIEKVIMYRMSTGEVFESRELALKAEIRVGQFNLLAGIFHKYGFSFDLDTLPSVIANWEDIVDQM